jgi:serine/threonine protein phosphatase 1
MKNHYVIGDIHGDYEQLLDLVSKLPKDVNLIFVGDLIDRGLQSREVVQYLRENNYQVIKGNHEQFMVEEGQLLVDKLLADEEVQMNNVWMFAGGIETLQSYGVLEYDGFAYKFVKNIEGIAQLQEDINWMKELPLYVQMENPHNAELPIVISHASIGDYWDLEEKNYKYFEFYIMSNRRRPSEQSPIFNIYGHTNVTNVVIGKNFVCLDTGCGRSDGTGKLSAYCVETQEVIEARKS